MSPQTRSSCIGYSLERCPRRTRGPRPTMIAPVEESATGAARTSQKAAAEHVPFRSKFTLSQVGTLKDPIRIPGSRIVCPTRKGAKPRCTCQNLKRSVRYEANCVHDFDDRRHDRPFVCASCFSTVTFCSVRRKAVTIRANCQINNSVTTNKKNATKLSSSLSSPHIPSHLPLRWK